MHEDQARARRQRPAIGMIFEDRELDRRAEKPLDAVQAAGDDHQPRRVLVAADGDVDRQVVRLVDRMGFEPEPRAVAAERNRARAVR